jgi:pyruvate/2-oxoglutarate dehydrogenase complex dihydrolipoamide dehydrogenase (E3) component
MTMPKSENNMQQNIQPAIEARSDQIDAAYMKNVHPEGWKNPKPAGVYNLVVIGAGPAGLVAARGAAALGAKVALIERGAIGGDCLNVGCVPSKTLIRTARTYADMRAARNYGAQDPGVIDVDFQMAMERIRSIRARISKSDSIKRLSEEGIDVYLGAARFSGPTSVVVDNQTLHFKKALIATGARPMIPDVAGLNDAGYLTNETVFDLTELPRRLLVVGGGPLGCELAQAFCRLGSQVTIVQDEAMFLPGEERDAAQLLSGSLARDGIEIRLNTTFESARREGTSKIASLRSVDYASTIECDAILVGVGRAPNVDNLNLEAAGVRYDSAEGISVNDFLQTTNNRIYAAGDVCLEHKFTHTADASARIALQNALFLGRKRLSSLTIPWCTYTDPEIAHVGMYVREATAKGIAINTITILMHDVDRAITDGEEEGFVKIHLRSGTDQILGATMVARHAGEMINDVTLAIERGLGLRTLSKVIHAYPTQAEAFKKAADAYNRTRLTTTLKFLSKRWLAWSREHL